MYTIIFSGHIMDLANREVPRLPREKENAVKSALREELLKIKRIHNDSIRGIAGGAAGGDILFHEVCKELHIPSILYLGLPFEKFILSSVLPSGQSWLQRFEKIYNGLPAIEFPLVENNSPSEHWETVNHWMMDAATTNGNDCVSVLLLWDEADGDGGGGTSHMAALAAKNRLNITVINPHFL